MAIIDANHAAVKAIDGDEAPLPEPATGPGTADLDWWASNAPANAAGFEVVGPTRDEIDPDPFGDPEERAAYEAWLDGQAPSDDELARRDLGDCGFGHPGWEVP